MNDTRYSSLDTTLGYAHDETKIQDTGVIYENNSPLNYEVFKPSKVEQEQQPTTGWGQAVGAYFRRNDPFYNVTKNVSDAFYSLSELSDPNRERFDPIPMLSAFPSYMWSELATTVTEGEFYRRVASLEIDKEDRELSDNATWYTALSAGIVGSASNPFYALGVGQAPAILSPLKSAITAGIESFTTAALAEAATESVLLDSQRTREITESLYNVGIAGVTAGMLGGLGGAIRSAKYPIYKEMVEAQLNGEVAHFKMTPKGEVEGLNIYDDMGIYKRTVDLHGEQLLGLNSKGEYSAASPFIWFAGKATQNPVIKMLTSNSPTAAKFANDWLEHSMDIVGSAAQGKNRPQSIQTKIQAWDAKTLKGIKLVTHGYQEYLGHTPGFSLKDVLRGKFAPPPGMLTMEEFSKALYYPIIAGEPHANPVVNKYSKMIKDQVFEYGKEELIGVGKLPEGIEVEFAEGYINRMYDIPYMETNTKQVKDFFYDEYKQAQDFVVEETQHLRSLVNTISGLEEKLLSVTNPKTKASLEKRLKKTQDLHAAEDARLQSKMRSGEYDKINPYIVNREKDAFSFAPIVEDLDLRLRANSKYNAIVGLTEEDFVDQMIGKTAGSTGTTGSFLMERTNRIHDKKLYDNNILITDIRKNIQAFNSRVGRVVEISKYMQATGLERDGVSYAKALADDIGLDFLELEGKQNERFAALREKAVTDEQLAKIDKQEKKASSKLKKQERAVKSAVADAYGKLAGTQFSKFKGFQRIARFSNNWANATQLGALVTLLPQDIVAPMFRSGAVNWFARGPVSFIGNLAKQGANKKLREQAADLLLGCDLERSFYTRDFNVMSDLSLPLNALERFAQKSATAMGIVSGATALSDLAQRWAVTATLSKTARNLRELVAGTISENDAIQLSIAGLRDIEIAKDLVHYIDKHGETLSTGAIYVDWNKWDKGLTDVADIRKARQAAQTLQNAIAKQVRSTNFSGANIASYPSGVPINPISSAILPYMGWIFNAQANYMIPLLQRYDPNKVVGFFAMTSMAALSDPLRQLAMGKEPELDPGVLLQKGLLGGGFLGVAGDVFNRLNTAGKMFPSLAVDRYERKGLELLSPITGLLNVGAKTAGMVINSEYNKKDILNFIYAYPLTRAIEFRGIIKELVDSLDIAENRNEAATEGE